MATSTYWARCFELLPKVSRTFALSISLLRPSSRQVISVAYLLCRVVDTLEDAPTLSLERKASRIRELQAILGGRALADWHREVVLELDGGASAHDLELMAALPEVLAALTSLPAVDRQSIGRCFDEMATGMIEMQEVLEAHGTELRQLPSLASLGRYCHYVAGTVGTLLTEHFYYHSEHIDKERYFALLDDAESFGQALQLINILKDAADDLGKGWCFLPRECLEAQGLSPVRLFEAERREEAIAALAPVMERVLGHVARAWRYLSHMPVEEREVRLFLAYSLFFGIRTLRIALEEPETMLDPERVLKIGRVEVGLAIAEVTARIEAPERLEAHYRALWAEVRPDVRWPEEVGRALSALQDSGLALRS